MNRNFISTSLSVITVDWRFSQGVHAEFPVQETYKLIKSPGRRRREENREVVRNIGQSADIVPIIFFSHAIPFSVIANPRLDRPKFLIV